MLQGSYITVDENKNENVRINITYREIKIIRAFKINELLKI